MLAGRGPRTEAQSRFLPKLPRLQLDDTNELRGIDEEESMDLVAALADLRSAVKALEYKHVKRATHTVFRVWVRNLRTRNPESDDDYMYYWDVRVKISKLGSKLVAKTLEPGAQRSASLCVIKFCNAVLFYRKKTNAFCLQEDFLSNPKWLDVPIRGAPVPLLALLLTRYATQECWCDPWGEVWRHVEKTGEDSTVRMLQCALLLFGALCNRDQTERDCALWRHLAHRASLPDGCTREPESVDEFLSLLLHGDTDEYWAPDGVANTNLRALLSAMCDARTLAKPRLPSARVHRSTTSSSTI